MLHYLDPASLRSIVHAQVNTVFSNSPASCPYPHSFSSSNVFALLAESSTPWSGYPCSLFTSNRSWFLKTIRAGACWVKFSSRFFWKPFHCYHIGFLSLINCKVWVTRNHLYLLKRLAKFEGWACIYCPSIGWRQEPLASQRQRLEAHWIGESLALYTLWIHVCTGCSISGTFLLQVVFTVRPDLNSKLQLQSLSLILLCFPSLQGVYKLQIHQ